MGYVCAAQDRDGFLRFSVLNRVSFLHLLALCSQCDPLIDRVPELHQLKLQSVGAQLNKKETVC